MTAKYQSRRAAINSRPRATRTLDRTPIEIPASTRTIPDTREMVRQTVQAALRQAGASKGYDSVDQMIAEETDLEPEDPDPPWTSQYEVTEMDEVEPAPLEEAPPQVGEQNKDETRSEQQAHPEKDEE